MDADRLVEQTAPLLRARGERMTGPRRVVLRALAENPGHHSADDVARLVATLDDTVHRSSVYRCLEALCGLGVVQHVHVGHGTTVYHLAEGESVHAQCRHCGALVSVLAISVKETPMILAFSRSIASLTLLPAGRPSG